MPTELQSTYLKVIKDVLSVLKGFLKLELTFMDEVPGILELVPLGELDPVFTLALVPQHSGTSQPTYIPRVALAP